MGIHAVRLFAAGELFKTSGGSLVAVLGRRRSVSEDWGGETTRGLKKYVSVQINPTFKGAAH